MSRKILENISTNKIIEKYIERKLIPDKDVGSDRHDHLKEIVNTSDCLTLVDGKEGDDEIQLSDWYVESIDKVSKEIQCRINIKNCIPFYDDLNREQRENLSSAVLQESLSLLDEIQKNPELVETLSEEVRELVILNPELSALSAKVDERNSFGLPMKEVIQLVAGNAAARTSLDQFARGGLVSFGVARGQRQFSVEIGTRATQIFVKTLDAIGVKVKSLDKKVENLPIEKQQSRANWMRQTMRRGFRLFSGDSAKNLVAMLARNGYSASLVGGLFAGGVIAAIPLVRDYADGELKNGVPRGIRRCEGQKYTMLPGQGLAGYTVDTGNPYYDEWAVEYKNKRAKKGDCTVFPIVNLSKFGSYFNYGDGLFGSLVENPQICLALKTVIQGYGFSLPKKKTKKSFEVQCPVGDGGIQVAGQSVNSNRLKVNFEGEGGSNLEYRHVFGPSVDVEFHRPGEKGAIELEIPTKIISPKGYSPTSVKAMGLTFKELNMGPDLRPVMNRNAGNFKESFHQECHGTFRFFDGFCGAPLARQEFSKDDAVDFGRSVNAIPWNCEKITNRLSHPHRDHSKDERLNMMLEICKGTSPYSKQRSTRFNTKKGQRFRQLGSRLGITNLLGEVDPLKTYDESLSNREKQFVGYTTSALSLSEKLNGPLMEAKICCQCMDSSNHGLVEGEIHSCSLLAETCERSYGISFKKLLKGQSAEDGEVSQ